MATNEYTYKNIEIQVAIGAYSENIDGYHGFDVCITLIEPFCTAAGARPTLLRHFLVSETTGFASGGVSQKALAASIERSELQVKT